MRPKKLRALLAFVGCGVIAAGAALGTGAARADGELSTWETPFVIKYHDAVCQTMDEYPTLPGVMGIAEVISEYGFADGDVADIINASVAAYCPRHWDLLETIGRAARGELAA